MPQYADLYFLIESRDKRKVCAFLDTYLPEREETADDYVVNNGDESLVLTDLNALMDYLEQNTNVDQVIYWRNLDALNIHRYGMVFYTDDGYMIFGISMEGRLPNDGHVEDEFTQLKANLKIAIGCITIEESPPVNSVEFRSFCENRHIPGKGLK